MLDGPTLPPLHSRAQHKVTVLALEAVDMIIPPQSSDPGSLSLTFLREDGQLAGTTAQCELSVIVLGAVGLVLLVQSDHLTIKLLRTDRALETVVMEPHLPDHQGRVTVSRDLLPAGRAGPGADQLHVVLLAHHHALHHADPLQDEVVTDTADMTDTTEIFFTDWKIFVGEILVHHLLPAHLTLHTLAVDAGVPEGDVALRDDLLADGAPGGGVALATTTRPSLHEKLLSEPFLTELASEAIFMI